MKSHNLTYARLAIMTRYNTLFFQFDLRDFCRALLKQGYILTDEAMKIPFGAAVRRPTKVGNRGEFAIIIAADNHAIVLEGPSPSLTLEETKKIDSMLRADLDFDQADLIAYCEFSVLLAVKSKENPVATWRNHLVEAPIFVQLSEVFGQPVSPYSINFGPVDGDPTQTEWYEMRIGPLIRPGLDHYLIEAVYRHQESSKVLEFVGRFENIVKDTLTAIEQG